MTNRNHEASYEAVEDRFNDIQDETNGSPFTLEDAVSIIGGEEGDVMDFLDECIELRLVAIQDDLYYFVAGDNKDMRVGHGSNLHGRAFEGMTGNLDVPTMIHDVLSRVLPNDVVSESAAAGYTDLKGTRI